MSLQVYGADDLDQFIASAFAAATGGISANTGKGSQFGPAFKAIRLAMQLLQNENVYINSISRLQNMQDPLSNGDPNPDVDTFMNAFWPGPGNFRRSNIAASGYVTFSTPSNVTQDLVIPVGTIVFRSSDQVQYVVAAGGTGYNANAGGYIILNGTNSVSAFVQCVTAGSIGNALIGAINEVYGGPGGQSLPTSLSVTNPNAFINGLDFESGQPLKDRFAKYISGGGEGTPTSIMAAVAGYQTGLTYSYGDFVASAASGSNWILTPNTPAWFTVVVNIANQAAAPPQSLLDGIRAALLYDVRAGGISFNVIPPVLQQVAGAGTVYVLPGYTSSVVLAAVQAAFAAFVNAIGLDPYGNPTSCSLQGAYVATSPAAVPGVQKIDGLTLNGSTADVVAAFGTQLVAGSTSGFVAA